MDPTDKKSPTGHELIGKLVKHLARHDYDYIIHNIHISHIHIHWD